MLFGAPKKRCRNSLLKYQCCVNIKLEIRDFSKPANLIKKPGKDKTLREGMIRQPETEFLVESGLRKKGSPQRVSLFGGFFGFNPNVLYYKEVIS